MGLQKAVAHGVVKCPSSKVTHTELSHSGTQQIFSEGLPGAGNRQMSKTNRGPDHKQRIKQASKQLISTGDKFS